MSKCERCSELSFEVTEITGKAVFGKCKDCGYEQKIRPTHFGEFEVQKVGA